MQSESPEEDAESNQSNNRETIEEKIEDDKVPQLRIATSSQLLKRRPNSFAGTHLADSARTGVLIVGSQTQIRHMNNITSPLINVTPLEAESHKTDAENYIRRRNTVSTPSPEPNSPPREGSVIEGKKRRSLKKKKDKSDSDSDVVQFGTKIGEDHRNYVLMYDMLTGIRCAVSRCEAKPLRDVTNDDFKAAHKLAFDITGNELTPSSKYDFKFKDYAPWVFRHIRKEFKIDAAEYLISLTGKYVLSEMGSSGKSGSFFYYSRDYRFIIKTIHHEEHRFMRKILRNYYNHIKQNPDTLISRFYGLYRVKLPHSRKIHFVVMGNIFPPHKDIHEIYDLKGSTVGRMVSKESIEGNPRSVRKDLNWLEKKMILEINTSKRKILIDQIHKDCKKHLISSVNPKEYATRFIRFLYQGILCLNDETSKVLESYFEKMKDVDLADARIDLNNIIQNANKTID
ncbi:SAICAR synthase-like protein [Rozella allomycis CSF55]|uniref:1-phosphatidylinositol-4-phosphate 5-kinase n=1 Tax=Rozella allomycis (strain CSF55) TaxID=988480 RepID=A0A4P9YGE0_ROZAC|nr:SAICAR synthase-like protein [Rozella allomycis CSF55]